MTANSFIPSDTAVIECRGKYMLNNPGLIKVNTRADGSRQILTKSTLLQASKNNPYVLQHKLNNELEVLVDGTTYGNDSRYVVDERKRLGPTINLLITDSAGEPARAQERAMLLSGIIWRREVYIFTSWPHAISRRTRRFSFHLSRRRTGSLRRR